MNMFIYLKTLNMKLLFFIYYKNIKCEITVCIHTLLDKYTYTVRLVYIHC